MAATQHLHYASNHQPSLPIATLLRNERAIELLRRLSASACTLAELDLDAADQDLLRRMQQLNLVISYEVAGLLKYRAKRLPPAVRLAIAA